jgi:hypothetical protein
MYKNLTGTDRFVKGARNLLAACLICTPYSSALPEEGKSNWRRIPNETLDQPKFQGHPRTTIVPVFSQIVAFTSPSGFKPVLEKTVMNTYTWEAVLNGETENQWSQMITITGAMGLAANPNLNPTLFTARIASGFKAACPNTFSTKRVSASQISGFDAFVALAGCGSVQYNNGNQHSETTLLISIKGSNDYYTLQWAERGPAIGNPIDLNDAKWQDRLKMLNPIKICARVPGESAPYPSCIGK